MPAAAASLVAALVAVLSLAAAAGLARRAPPGSRAGYYARLALSLLCLLVCAVYGVLASAALRLAGHGGLSQWTVARSFKWTMRLVVGVRFDVINDEYLATRPAVFVGNHQTELDVLMLGTIFPPYCSVTAKKQLKWVPFLGWFMALSKTVFIDRGNRETARAAFDGAARQMHSERQSVYIFPEGTRSYTAKPDMLPFKKGAFHLAVQARVPVVPIVVANYAHILHFQDRVFNTGAVPVKVLPPVSTEKLTAADVDDLMERVRADMQRELTALTLLAQHSSAALAVPAASASSASGAAPSTSSSSSSSSSAAKGPRSRRA